MNTRKITKTLVYLILPTLVFLTAGCASTRQPSFAPDVKGKAPHSDEAVVFNSQFNARDAEKNARLSRVNFTKPDDFPLLFSPAVLSVGGEANWRQGEVKSDQLTVKGKFYVVPTGEISDRLVVEANGTQHWFVEAKEVWRCHLSSVTHFTSGLSIYRSQNVGVALPAGFLFLVCYDPRKPEQVSVASIEQAGAHVLARNCSVVRSDNIVLGQVDFLLSPTSLYDFDLKVAPDSTSFKDLTGPCLKLHRNREMLPGEVNELSEKLKHIR